MFAKRLALLRACLGTLALISLGTFPAIGQSVQSARPSDTTYYQPRRPQFHFSTKQNWLGKPTGLLYHKGEYHLFFQYNPQGAKQEHISWGHAVSKDLQRWQELAPVITEDSVMAFSGSCVIDRKNTAGFGRNAMVAIYTAHQKGNQSQHLAYSLDRGRTFKKYTFNPVLDVNRADFSDPHVFWWKDLKRWVMTVALPNDQRVHFYQSKNLRNWVSAGSISAPNPAMGQWESPALINVSSWVHQLRLSPELGGGTLGNVVIMKGGRAFDNQSLARRWVLLVSVSSGAPSGGSGVQYFVGTFNGDQFMPQDNKTRWLDYGTDFYGAIPVNKPEENGAAYPVIMGWMNNREYADNLPTASFRSSLTLPRRLKINPEKDGTYSLLQIPDCLCPIPKGDSITIRSTNTTELSQRVGAFLAGSTSYMLSIKARALDHAVHLRTGSGQEETVVRFDSVAKAMVIDRSHSGAMITNPAFATEARAPFEPIRNSPNTPGVLFYQIYVDRSSVEVFGSSATCKLTSLIFPGEQSNGLSFAGHGVYEVSVRRIHSNTAD